MIEYNEIFTKAEKTLKQHSWLSPSDFEKQYGQFKKYKNNQRTDQEYYDVLIQIIFYSGFKAATVEKYKKVILSYFNDYLKVSEYSDSDIQRILDDQQMISNRKKIMACISNAQAFRIIIEKYGAFRSYLDSFEAHSSFENLLLLKEDLEYRFDYLGSTTVYHFLTELGYNVLKPDRVILRIFKRLGLIESNKQLFKTVLLGRQFSKATNLPIRYIDIIFVKYGQQGKSNEFGLTNGICLEKNSQCNICNLKAYCNYYKSKSS